MTDSRPPVPPFDNDSAAQIVRMAEGAWNTRDPGRVFLVYIPNTQGHNRGELAMRTTTTLRESRAALRRRRDRAPRRPASSGGPGSGRRRSA